MTFYVLSAVTHELEVVPAGGDFYVQCTCGFHSGNFTNKLVAEMRRDNYPCELEAQWKTWQERRETRLRLEAEERAA